MVRQITTARTLHYHQLCLGATLRTRPPIRRIRQSRRGLSSRRLGFQWSRHFRVWAAIYTQHLGREPGVCRPESNPRRSRLAIPACRTPNANLWFNPAAFTAPQSPGRNGDVRHNSFRGPGLYNFDLSLGKIFTVAEGKTLEFKWENYNATNHVNLANPNPTVDVTGAGQITRGGYNATDAIRIAFPLLTDGRTFIGRRNPATK